MIIHYKLSPTIEYWNWNIINYANKILDKLKISNDAILVLTI
jgi:hypothetical protein